MHELSIALSILDLATEEAERHSGRVAAVHLKLGILSGVVPDALRSAYDLAREGTPLAEAELVVEEVPIVAHCPACGWKSAIRNPISEPSSFGFRASDCGFPADCPACGTPTPDIIRGRELEVVALEIES